MRARRADELAAHTAALRQLLTSESRELFRYLYECLNILDAKSNSLLQFNSIILVAFGTALHGSGPGPWILWLSFTGIALTLASSMLLLSVVLVRWIGTAHVPHFEVDFLRLRDERTLRYRIAWLLSLTTLVIVSLGVLRIFAVCSGEIHGC
jgi:hypothetical protein